MIKLEIWNFTTKYAVWKIKSKCNQILVLERRLKLLEMQQPIHTSIFKDTEHQISLVKQDLNKLVEEKTRGAVT